MTNQYDKIERFVISGGPLDGSTQKLAEPIEVDAGSFTYAECGGQGYDVEKVENGTAFLMWIPQG